MHPWFDISTMIIIPVVWYSPFVTFLTGTCYCEYIFLIETYVCTCVCVCVCVCVWQRVAAARDKKVRRAGSSRALVSDEAIPAAVPLGGVSATSEW